MYIKVLVLLLVILLHAAFSLVSGVQLPVKSLFRDLYANVLASVGAVEGASVRRIGIDGSYGGDGEGIIGMLGPASKQTEIQFVTESHSSEHFEYARMVSFCGGGYDVFNLLLMPKIGQNLPIFGADVVCLPGGALAAIDFQPARESDGSEYYQSPLYRDFAGRIEKFRSKLPEGGDLPPAAQRYFSPYALWTRTPPLFKGDESMQLVTDSVLESLEVYLGLLTSPPDPEGMEVSPVSQFLKDYLRYRVENDPAKRLLEGAFGKTWTKEVIESVLFPDPY